MDSAQSLRKALNHLGNTAVYVIRQDTHEILFFNEKVEKITPLVRAGMICHELWSSCCQNCPLLSIGDRETNTTVSYGSDFGDIVDICATSLLWGPEDIPAYLISVTPHTPSMQEQELELERKKLAVVAGQIYPLT